MAERIMAISIAHGLKRGTSEAEWGRASRAGAAACVPQEPRMAERIMAISIIAGMVPTNCMTNMRQSGSFSSGISFFPHSAICSAA